MPVLRENTLINGVVLLAGTEVSAEDAKGVTADVFEKPAAAPSGRKQASKNNGK